MHLRAWVGVGRCCSSAVRGAPGLAFDADQGLAAFVALAAGLLAEALLVCEAFRTLWVGADVRVSFCARHFDLLSVSWVLSVPTLYHKTSRIPQQIADLRGSGVTSTLPLAL